MRYALNDRGEITKCTAPEDRIGTGRCNHILHQRDGESIDSFLSRASVYNEHVTAYNDRLSQLAPGEIIRPPIEVLATFPESNNANGLQPKWHWAGYLYKEDAGDNDGTDEFTMSQRNALSEEMACKILLGNVTLPSGETIPHAECDALVDVESGKHVCRSKSFLKSGETVVDADQLLEKRMVKLDSGEDVKLSEWLLEESDMNLKFKTLSQALSESSGIPVEECEEWLAHTITVDIIMLNNDRHLGNIGFIHSPSDGKLRFAPLYDHGSALFADRQSDHVDEFNFWEDKNSILSDPSTLGMCPSYEYMDMLFDWYYEHPDRRLRIKMDAFQNACESYNCNNEINGYPESIMKRNKAIMQAQIEELHDQGLLVLENWNPDEW